MKSSVQTRPRPETQYGALPFRRTPSGHVEVLLVTSRRTRRWILPKGWPIDGLTPAASAAREAFEEAGVLGTVSAEAIGSYAYLKDLPNGHGRHCEVYVFALEVQQQLDHWPERNQRTFKWVSPAEALEMISDESAKPLIRTASML